jgi:DNA repair photolyase
VLVAPVLPGISDAPEQLEEVVSACLEAGATSLSSILLHLRPGVRELYLPWLQRERPDLVAAYETLYASPSGYVSPEARRAHAGRIAQLTKAPAVQAYTRMPAKYSDL